MAVPASDRTPLPTVLALVDYYPPAYRAGGPTRSVPRIAELLVDALRFRVITRHGDLGSGAPLAGVAPDRWIECGRALCLYLSAGRLPALRLVSALRGTDHDLLYLNSIFSAEFAMLPLVLRRLRLIPRRALLVAPRGELNASALAIKGRRKTMYLRIARALGLLRGATWHAATAREAQEVRRAFGARATVRLAVDIPAPPAGAVPLPPKEPGSLSVVFLGRISRMKNLELAIDALANVTGAVAFDLYGPIEDPVYWEACQRRIATLPPNVTATYRGAVAPEDVARVVAGYHLLFLPSRAESFGHVIVEALGVGRPVLIGDQTPWRDLERKLAGWALPLRGAAPFTEVLERCLAMTGDDLARWSSGALRVAREIAEDPSRDAAYRLMFEAAVSASRRA